MLLYSETSETSDLMNFMKLFHFWSDSHKITSFTSFRVQQHLTKINDVSTIEFFVSYGFVKRVLMDLSPTTLIFLTANFCWSKLFLMHPVGLSRKSSGGILLGPGIELQWGIITFQRGRMSLRVCLYPHTWENIARIVNAVQCHS